MRITGTVTRPVPLSVVVNRPLTLSGSFDTTISDAELIAIGPTINVLVSSKVLTNFQVQPDMIAAAAPWESNKYYFLPNATNTSSSATLGNGTLRLIGFDVPNPVTIDRLGAEVTVIGDVGSKVRLGIFTISGTTATLVVDAGQIAGDFATIQERTGLSTVLNPGRYYCGVAVQNAPGTQPTLRTAAAGSAGEKPLGYLAAPTAGQVGSGYLALGVTDTFPATIPITDIHNSFARVYCKVV